MKIKTFLCWATFLTALFLAAGLASCSNPDERPLDTFFPAFPNPLPRSPVGVVFSDPVFRQVEPDPLIRESYLAADLQIMTSQDMWDIFLGASQRIDIAGTRITNAQMVSRLVGKANQGIPINIVAERGFFDDPEAAPLISQLSQTGNVTIHLDNDDIARQMHSHYAIIDDHYVLASSGDFLDESFNTSINNTLIFDTPRHYVNGAGAGGVETITDAFLFDFDQMFNQGRFGGDKERLNDHFFNIGVTIEVYFGPNDNLYAEIVQEANNMQSNLSYAIYQLNDPNMIGLVNALADVGYFDWFVNPDYADEDNIPYIPSAMRFAWPGFNALGHKFLLIDLPADVTTTISPALLDIVDPVVITGSCNWTHSGLELNDEQMIVAHDLTLGFEYAVEMSALGREAAGYGVVFGTVRTNKNVAIPGAELTCDSESIPGGVFNGDGGTPAEAGSDGNGNYALLVPTGFLRNIQVINLGDASGLYLLPDPIWGADMPNDGWNLLPGSSYRADFYCSPAPSATGTGG